MANKQLTEKLAKSFVQMSQAEGSSDLCEQYEGKLSESAARGGFDALDIDPKTLLEAHMAHDEDLKVFIGKAADHNVSYPALMEGVSAYTTSSFQQHLNTIYRVGALQTAPIADRVLSTCVGEMQVGCERNVDLDMPQNNVLPVMAKKGQSTDFFQLGDVNAREYTKPAKWKFGYQLFREDLCNRWHSTYMQIMRNGQENFANLRQMLVQRLFGNMFALDENGVPKGNMPYIYNGVSYNFYQPIGGDGLWGNYHMGSPLLADGSPNPDSNFPCPSRCNLDFWCFIERLMEDKTDIRANCFPVQFDMGNMTILTASKKTAKRMQQMLGASTVTMQVATDDGCEAEKSFAMAAQEGIAGYKYDKWFREALIQYYQTVYGTSLSYARKLADCFWAVGDWESAFKWQTEWAMQSFERGDFAGNDNTAENINNECIGTIKHMMKAGPVGDNPCAFYMFFPVPVMG